MRIYISDLSFSYDLHSLTKAFFQSEDVEVKEWGSEISNNVEAFYYRVETPDGEVREVRVENCGEDRPQFKNKIKREVYIILSELTGRKLPWGTLTGIRPTKLPMSMILDKKSDDEISTFLKDTYLVTDERLNFQLILLKRKSAFLSHFMATGATVFTSEFRFVQRHVFTARLHRTQSQSGETE